MATAERLARIHDQLSALRLQLLDTKVLISREQASASRFTISIAKEMFRYIDHYKESQFAQLLEISEISKRLVDQVLVYRGLHLDASNPQHIADHALPLIDDIFDTLTRELLLLQVRIKDLALNASFAPPRTVPLTEDSLAANSRTLDRMLKGIELDSKKRDKDFVLELIKREFNDKRPPQGQQMNLGEMERYVSSMLSNSTRNKNDVSLQDLLAISISKVPLTQRLRDWEQASQAGDSDGVKSVIKGTKSIRRLIEMSAPLSEADPSKKVKKIEFSGSYKKPEQKDLPFTHSKLDALVFQAEDTRQLSQAMIERRKKLREEATPIPPLEDSFTISTNISCLKDMSLRSDVDQKFKKLPKPRRPKQKQKLILSSKKYEPPESAKKIKPPESARINYSESSAQLRRGAKELEVSLLESDDGEDEEKKSLLPLSRNKSALGVSEQKGVLRTILQQQGRTTTATSMSDERDLPAIESFRAAGAPKKRVALERKLRKMVVESSYQHQSMPISPRSSRKATDVRVRVLKKN